MPSRRRSTTACWCAAAREGVTLRKTRWCMLYAGRVLEIDVYPFWEHTAVLEIELPDDAPVSIRRRSASCAR